MTDKVKIVQLGKDARALLDALADRLPAPRVKRLRTYSKVGELTLLVDGLCATLVKNQVPIDHQERDALAAVLALFDPPVVDGGYINEAENTLTALNVVA